LIKNKHKDLMVVGILGVSFIVGGLIYLNGRSIDAVISGYQAQVPEQLRGLSFDQKEYEELGDLIRETPNLSHPPTVKSRDVRFAMLDKKSQGGAIKVQRFVRVKPFNYKVSMVFISKNSGYAVVEGRFVTVGDLLWDGAIIKGIRKGKVKIARKDGTRWVKVH